MESGDALTPGVIALIAVFSIGGLAFVGWQAALVGNAIDVPYYACCSIEAWENAPTGYAQGTAVTSTEACESFESPSQCCVRTARERGEKPFRFLGAVYGQCGRPSVSYPVHVTGPYGYGKS